MQHEDVLLFFTARWEWSDQNRSSFCCSCVVRSLCFLNVQAEKLVPAQLLYYITNVKVGKVSSCTNCSDWREILIVELLDLVGHSCLLYVPYQSLSLFSRLLEFFCFATCSRDWSDWSRQTISQKWWVSDTWQFFRVLNRLEHLFHCRKGQCEDASWIVASFFSHVLFL